MDRNVVEVNREMDVWLLDGAFQLCYYIPQGWCDQCSVANGYAGGLDFINDEGKPAPEINCYGPLYTEHNSAVDIQFVSVLELQKMTLVTKADVKRIHPALIDHLNAINNEQRIERETKQAAIDKEVRYICCSYAGIPNQLLGPFASPLLAFNFIFQHFEKSIGWELDGKGQREVVKQGYLFYGLGMLSAMHVIKLTPLDDKFRA